MLNGLCRNEVFALAVEMCTTSFIKKDSLFLKLSNKLSPNPERTSVFTM